MFDPNPLSHFFSILTPDATRLMTRALAMRLHGSEWRLWAWLAWLSLFGRRRGQPPTLAVQAFFSVTTTTRPWWQYRRPLLARAVTWSSPKREDRPARTTTTPSSAAPTRLQAQARLIEGGSGPDQIAWTAALTRQGLQVLTPPIDDAEPNDGGVVVGWYKWNAAVGMLQLIRVLHGGDDNVLLLPRWVPLLPDEEVVLVKNGWGFLDTDESEPLSSFDVEAANWEGQYRPVWQTESLMMTTITTTESSSCSITKLGFAILPWTADQVREGSQGLDNEQTRRVLLEGATDPPGRKLTHNGVSFAGSLPLMEAGIFVGALGEGWPLFASSDLKPTTASSGWLSFRGPISWDHVLLIQPQDRGNHDLFQDQRIEVVCARTRGHLGHYFGPEDGFCINASALNFVSVNAAGVDKRLIQAPYSYRTLERIDPSPSILLLKKVLRNCLVTERIGLGAGCFWHVEFALRRLPGVVETKTGYAGGLTVQPTYETVCQGETGHAEVVLVEFDPSILPVRCLVDCFLALHDPTRVRAHGKHATGTGQYRSCIFIPADSTSYPVAVQALQDCQVQLGKALSTEIRRVGRDPWFWEAESRHQRHDEKRGNLYDTDLGTLSLTEWLELYGQRKPAILGSAQTAS